MTHKIYTLLKLAVCCACISIFSLHNCYAVLPVVSSGETVLFSEDFTSTSTGWTDTSGTSQIFTDNSIWGPATASNGTTVVSSLTLGTAINAANGPISIYFSMSVVNIAGADSNWVRVQLFENGSNRYFGLRIKSAGTATANQSVILTRNSGGTAIETATSETQSIFSAAGNNTFVTFKITLTPGNTLSDAATVETFYYNTTTSTYVSLGSVTGASLSTGLFDTITIGNRNASPSGAGYIDSVVITQLAQVPEPATYAIVLAMIGAFVVAFKRFSFLKRVECPKKN